MADRLHPQLMREALDRPWNTMTRSDKALAYAFALEAGIVSQHEVVSWVDSLLLKETSPAGALLDASLAADVGGLVSSLHRFAGSPRSDEVAREVLRISAQAVEEDESNARRVARLLFRLALEDVVPNEEAKGKMFWFDDAVELAEAGYSGTLDDVLHQLRTFLAKYRDGAV